MIGDTKIVQFGEFPFIHRNYSAEMSVETKQLLEDSPLFDGSIRNNNNEQNKLKDYQYKLSFDLYKSQIYTIDFLKKTFFGGKGMKQTFFLKETENLVDKDVDWQVYVQYAEAMNLRNKEGASVINEPKKTFETTLRLYKPEYYDVTSEVYVIDLAKLKDKNVNWGSFGLWGNGKKWGQWLKDIGVEYRNLTIAQKRAIFRDNCFNQRYLFYWDDYWLSNLRVKIENLDYPLNPANNPTSRYKVSSSFTKTLAEVQNRNNEQIIEKLIDIGAGVQYDNQNVQSPINGKFSFGCNKDVKIYSIGLRNRFNNTLPVIPKNSWIELENQQNGSAIRIEMTSLAEYEHLEIRPHFGSIYDLYSSEIANETVGGKYKLTHLAGKELLYFDSNLSTSPYKNNSTNCLIMRFPYLNSPTVELEFNFLLTNY